MKISARVENKPGEHAVVVGTEGRLQRLAMSPKTEGQGSSVNGGELLFAALATCYCNDLYREAKKRGIEIEAVWVEVSGEFGGVGEAARNISYRASVDSKASREEVLDLMRHTDMVAEVHNTLRQGIPVVFADTEDV